VIFALLEANTAPSVEFSMEIGVVGQKSDVRVWGALGCSGAHDDLDHVVCPIAGRRPRSLLRNYARTVRKERRERKWLDIILYSE